MSAIEQPSLERRQLEELYRQQISAVRTLANVPSGAISFSNLLGKSSMVATGHDDGRGYISSGGAGNADHTRQLRADILNNHLAIAVYLIHVYRYAVVAALEDN